MIKRLHQYLDKSAFRKHCDQIYSTHIWGKIEFSKISKFCGL
ncbi:hypothetical protein T11_4690 [Trichinella zimbabwensis]|uniref:Uncharacterized protein n=1 Tax=Trichinella zimbabwensis TaxID=268475 RepID=A0A0V1GAQ9_9BILA|nr:hypothetical protein T11_4690 [Trichinella zimbabwensis]